MGDWHIPLIIATAVFLLFILWQVRPAGFSSGGKERRLALREAHKQIEAAKDDKSRALALCEAFEKTGEELLARAFAHEIDHLNGRLYITHVSALKRDLIRRKVRKLVKNGEWD